MKLSPAVLVLIPLLAAAGGALPANPSKALMEPRWEVGLFNFVADLPHYRGANESRVYAFPTPYLIYRGEYLRADREGVRGIFYQDQHLETSISLSGNPPVSEDNEARAGMPGLDAIAEIGPAFKWYFLGRWPADRLYLQASARAAVSVPEVTYQGVAGALDAVYYNRSRFLAQGVKFRLVAGLNFGDRVYHGYFYDVAAPYATPQRPFYSAGGGYGGAALSFSMQYDMTPTVSLGFYSRWDNIAGAVFADSPLVRQDNNFVVGAALILRLFRSPVLVPSDEFN